jgi:hypothetical protein
VTFGRGKDPVVPSIPITIKILRPIKVKEGSEALLAAADG